MQLYYLNVLQWCRWSHFVFIDSWLIIYTKRVFLWMLQGHGSRFGPWLVFACPDRGDLGSPKRLGALPCHLELFLYLEQFGYGKDSSSLICWCFQLSMFFPKQCGNTWGSYGNGKRPGWLDPGGGRVARRIHRYFRGFVLACSFRLWIFVVSAWRRRAWAGFDCKFS